MFLMLPMKFNLCRVENNLKRIDMEIILEIERSRRKYRNTFVRESTKFGLQNAFENHIVTHTNT